MSQKESILLLLIQRKSELEKAIKQANQILKTPIEGYLEVNRQNNHYRYYLKPFTVSTNKTRTRTYIKDINIAKSIANHDYAKQVLKSSTQELKQILSLIATYSHTTADDCYQSLHPGRKLLVSPILIDDEQYANQWLSDIPITQNSYPVVAPILTENNEIVRSKSEKIIADKLKLKGIPYKYENPLHLGSATKYPDFTVLNKRTRKEYYWEHMGMIDNADYLKKAITKIETYYENEIILGKNLIITYETSCQPLSVKVIESLINEYLL